MLQVYNPLAQKTELQCYFHSDYQVFWPRIFVRTHEGDPLWLSFDLTRRPFFHAKVGLRSMLMISCFFKHVKVFVPIFFAILEEDHTPYAISRVLHKFKSEILDQLSSSPTQLFCSAEPQLTSAVREVFKNRGRGFPYYPCPAVSHVNFARKVKKLSKYFQVPQAKAVRNKIMELPFVGFMGLNEKWS